MRDQKSTIPMRAIFIACVVLGISIRVYFMSTSASHFDVGIISNWGRSIVLYGIEYVYRNSVNGTMLPNYPPLSLGIFGMMAHIYALIVGNVMKESMLLSFLMKLPSVLGDIALAASVSWMLRPFLSLRQSFAAGLVVLLHPVFWFVSAIWGQTDILFSLAAVLGIFALTKGRAVTAGFLFGIGILLKLQIVFVFPVAAVLLLRKPKSIPAFLLGFVWPIIIVGFPFYISGTLGDIAVMYRGLVGYYTALSVSALNIWWIAFHSSATVVSDQTLLFGFLSYRHTGLLIVSLFYGVFLWRVWRVSNRKSDQRELLETVLAACVICTMAMFMFATQMHERYFFLPSVFAVPLAFLVPRVRWNLAVFSIALFLNLILSYKYFHLLLDDKNWALSPGVLLSVINLLLFLDLSFFLFRRRR